MSKLEEKVNLGLDIVEARPENSGKIDLGLGLEASGRDGAFAFGELDYAHHITKGLSAGASARAGYDSYLRDWRAEAYARLRYEW